MAMTQLSRNSSISFSEEAQLKNEDFMRKATTAFLRSRRSALRRRASAFLGIGAGPSRYPNSGAAELFELALVDLAGLAGESSSLGLPPLPRRAIGSWIRELRRFEDAECLEPFAVSWARGYWFLEGGVRELMRLEFLRQRGQESALFKSRASLSLSMARRHPATLELGGNGQRVAC
jgi:hypothetical protein